MDRKKVGQSLSKFASTEKVAYSLSDFGGAVGKGARRVGKWAVNNPVDAALTATMFIPGLNVVGAGLRGASLLARGGMAAFRAGRGGSAALKAYRASRAGGAAAKAAYKGLGAGRGAASHAARARNLGGQAGQAFKGMNPLSRGAFGGGRHASGQFSNLGKGGRLWGGNWRRLKRLRGPNLGTSRAAGKLRQGVRLGTVGLEGAAWGGVSSQAAKSLGKDLRGQQASRLRPTPKNPNSFVESMQSGLPKKDRIAPRAPAGNRDWKKSPRNTGLVYNK